MKKQKKPQNYAFIDGANLYKGVKGDNWELDYTRFRVWLSEKYCVSKAYIFLGLVKKHLDLYTRLQEQGFILIFKETLEDKEGNIKGNCDSDLVLHVTRCVYEDTEFGKVILVSSDGDYASLVSFLLEKKRMHTVLSPNNKCSVLIKRTGAPITYLRGVRHYISYKKSPQ